MLYVTTYPSPTQYVLLVHSDSSIEWAGRAEIFSVSWDSPAYQTPLPLSTTTPEQLITFDTRLPMPPTHPGDKRWLLHETPGMLTLDCYESHVPRWDCEVMGEGVTHLPADTKISYY